MDAWPRELVLNQTDQTVRIAFDDGAEFRLPAEYLRVHSPSSEVQGHSPDQRRTVGGKRNVRITAIEPVGNYAVRLIFDDGHSTGIYSWTYLRELGRDHGARWPGYLAELAAKGLSRDR
jgi:DUF971 family protein